MMSRCVVRWRYILLPLVAVLLGACTTRPVTPPSWITGAVLLDDDSIVLVAYGRGRDREEARINAAEDAVVQIGQRIADELAARSIPLTETLAAEIEVVAAEREERLTPTDSYARIAPDGASERYDLLQYRLSSLEADVERLVGRSDSASDPAPSVSQDPLTKLETLFRAGVPAVAEEQSDVTTEMLSLASRVTISIAPGEHQLTLSALTPIEISVVVDNGGANSIDQLAARMRAPSVDGERETSETRVSLDATGRGALTIDPPPIAGVSVVTVEPVWLSELEPLWQGVVVSEADRQRLDAVIERLRARSIVRVRSQAASVPTAVVILDRDIAGNAITNGSDAMRGAIQELSESGFRVRQVDLSPPQRNQLSALETITVSDLYDVLPFDVLSVVDRVIVGNARILQFNEQDGFAVEVAMEAAAFDLRRDRELVRLTFEERVSGGDARAAIRVAFQAAGRRLGRRIAPRLP